MQCGQAAAIFFDGKYKPRPLGKQAAGQPPRSGANLQDITPVERSGLAGNFGSEVEVE